MALNIKNKKTLLFSVVGGAALLSFFLFKKGKKLYFIDNVWCEDDECSNVTPAFNGQYSNASGGTDDDTGMVNLLFKEKHNLEAGDNILVTQTGDGNGNVTYPGYDGWRRVSKVLTPYIIMLDIPRQGSTPVEGGYVQLESVAKRFF